MVSTTIVEKPELEVDTECPIAMVDAIIEKLTGADPSLSTAPTTLPNPIHTSDMVATNAINVQPSVEIVYNVKQNVGHDNTVSKPVRTLQDPSLSVVAPSTLYFPIGIPPNHVGVGLNIMEMLWNMSNNETLKELLEFSMVFAQMC